MTRSYFILIVFFGLLANSSNSQPNSQSKPYQLELSKIDYDTYFLNKTIRIDLIHTSDGLEDYLALDEIRIEGEWPGTRRYLIDPFNYGAYRFRVFDLRSGRLIFSQGYATLFGEWLTTEEALQGMSKAMSESIRFPMPKAPVKIFIDKRDKESGKFVQFFEMELDPASHLISTEKKYNFETLTLLQNGPPEQKVDIVIIPDGYREREIRKLKDDLFRFVTYFFRHEPFKSMKDRFNIRAVLAFSRESGTDEPRKGLFKDTILNTTFNTLDSERYLTTLDNKTMRDIASLVPYDTIYIMVNTSRYGGGGIYNFYSVFPSDNEYSEYVFIHEFGHGFGGLGDEYYDSPTTYDEENFYKEGVEPWEPNITAQTSRNRIKWGELIDPMTPVPTPQTFQYHNKVGLFEGAGYKAKGLYRSQYDCIMFHKRNIPFCAACMKALVKMIRYYTGEDL